MYVVVYKSSIFSFFLLFKLFLFQKFVYMSNIYLR